MVMNIKLIDSFGMHVGDAEVTWVSPNFGPDSGYESAGDLLRAIFAPSITVLLPTVNERMPWRMDITP
jgi:hypothetical protein